MTHHCDWQAHVESNRLACNSLFSKSLIGVSQISLGHIRFGASYAHVLKNHTMSFCMVLVKVCMKLMCASVVVV